MSRYEALFSETPASAYQSGMDAFASELSEVIGVQLSASRRDLAQAQGLLNDAIARLMSCLPAGEQSSGGGEALRLALVNLQFQDLVGQLLRRADDRMLGVDVLLQELAQILSANEPAALKAAMQLLGAQTLAPERRTSNSIQQIDMAPGDVELF